MNINYPHTCVITTALAADTLGMAIGVAQHPSGHVNPGRHPNLAAAQGLVSRAYQRVLDAQQANEWDMNGRGHRYT